MMKIRQASKQNVAFEVGDHRRANEWSVLKGQQNLKIMRLQ